LLLPDSIDTQSTTPSAKIQQKQPNPKEFANNQKLPRFISQFAKINLGTGLLLCCALYSVILLFSDWDYGTVDELFEGFARAVFLATTALIPATIANKKDREFTR
jgi:hypothetical protein